MIFWWKFVDCIRFLLQFALFALRFLCSSPILPIISHPFCTIFLQFWDVLRPRVQILEPALPVVRSGGILCQMGRFVDSSIRFGSKGVEDYDMLRLWIDCVHTADFADLRQFIFFVPRHVQPAPKFPPSLPFVPFLDCNPFPLTRRRGRGACVKTSSVDRLAYERPSALLTPLTAVSTFETFPVKGALRSEIGQTYSLFQQVRFRARLLATSCGTSAMAAAVVGVLRMTISASVFSCFVSEALLLFAKSFGHVSCDGRMQTYHIRGGIASKRPCWHEKCVAYGIIISNFDCRDCNMIFGQSVYTPRGILLHGYARGCVFLSPCRGCCWSFCQARIELHIHYSHHVSLRVTQITKVDSVPHVVMQMYFC